MNARLSEIERLLKLNQPRVENNRESWRIRATGPHWPVLRSFVALFDAAVELLSYVRELEEIIKEMDGDE